MYAILQRYSASSCRVALLQLALWDEIFLLDIPALLQELREDDWTLLATGLFNNGTILKLGMLL